MIEEPDDVTEFDPAVAVVVERRHRLVVRDPVHSVEVQEDVDGVASPVAIDVIVQQIRVRIGQHPCAVEDGEQQPHYGQIKVEVVELEIGVGGG